MQNNLSILLLSLRFALALILYTFLAYSIYVLSKNLNKNLSTAKNASLPTIHLSHSDQHYTFQQSEITLGRNPTCDLNIINETVSSNHARIFFEYNQWWVEDINSSNGSRLNSLIISSPVVLTNNDQLELGNALITISLEERKI